MLLPPSFVKSESSASFSDGGDEGEQTGHIVEEEEGFNSARAWPAAWSDPSRHGRCLDERYRFGCRDDFGHLLGDSISGALLAMGLILAARQRTETTETNGTKAVGFHQNLLRRRLSPTAKRGTVELRRLGGVEAQRREGFFLLLQIFTGLFVRDSATTRGAEVLE
ncbi:hypothetical protein J5N97_014068 [Dioscorea zingiberensis]|uniref:Uncharacterized protein n=1 Tax=Dioscorea zingiberensis TaxID=325984 RepID=A0A9D5CT87_9LILI|nr:hypothetical protein J5N97_014068 [Dioscorea zingiberensis]